MIEYKLTLHIYDDSKPGGSYTPCYEDKASLTVASLTAINDRDAFDTLVRVLRGKLVPEGSTVLELRAIDAGTRIDRELTDADTLIDNQ